MYAGLWRREIRGRAALLPLFAGLLHLPDGLRVAPRLLVLQAQRASACAGLKRLVLIIVVVVIVVVVVVCAPIPTSEDRALSQLREYGHAGTLLCIC